MWSINSQVTRSPVGAVYLSILHARVKKTKQKHRICPHALREEGPCSAPRPLSAGTTRIVRTVPYHQIIKSHATKKTTKPHRTTTFLVPFGEHKDRPISQNVTVSLHFSQLKHAHKETVTKTRKQMKPKPKKTEHGKKRKEKKKKKTEHTKNRKKGQQDKKAQNSKNEQKNRINNTTQNKTRSEQHETRNAHTHAHKVSASQKPRGLSTRQTNEKPKNIKVGRGGGGADGTTGGRT